MSRLNALVVGLGNYTHPLTRHSISQLALENIHNLLNHHHRITLNHSPAFPSSPTTGQEPASRIQSSQSSSDVSDHLRLSKPHSAWIARHDFVLHHDFRPQPTPTSPTNLSLHLLKPRAAMNISGPVVQSYHSQLSKTSHQTRLIIIHDELDLKPLAVRLKQPPQSSKHKGHNGLKSVFASLRACSPQNLYTIGIGIGRDASNSSKDTRDVGRWVLSPLTRSEIEACSWDAEHSPASIPQHQGSGSVVLEVWKQISEIIKH